MEVVTKDGTSYAFPSPDSYDGRTLDRSHKTVLKCARRALKKTLRDYPLVRPLPWDGSGRLREEERRGCFHFIRWDGVWWFPVGEIAFSRSFKASKIMELVEDVRDRYETEMMKAFFLCPWAKVYRRRPKMEYNTRNS